MDHYHKFLTSTNPCPSITVKILKKNPIPSHSKNTMNLIRLSMVQILRGNKFIHFTIKFSFIIQSFNQQCKMIKLIGNTVPTFHKIINLWVHVQIEKFLGLHIIIAKKKSFIAIYEIIPSKP